MKPFHDPQLQFTDDLVRQARMKAIERDHRSIGSIIDKRELFKIVDPPLRIPSKVESERRINSRYFLLKLSVENTNSICIRRTVRHEDNMAEDMLQELQNQPLDLENDNFDIEEQIWRTKSSSSNYIQVRYVLAI